MEVSWDKDTKEKFDKLMAKIPVLMRGIAEKRITQAAEKFTQQDNRWQVTEKDLVDAFFKETPFGFHGPMKADMESAGIDYTRYGYER